MNKKDDVGLFFVFRFSCHHLQTFMFGPLLLCQFDKEKIKFLLAADVTNVKVSGTLSGKETLSV